MIRAALEGLGLAAITVAVAAVPVVVATGLLFRLRIGDRPQLRLRIDLALLMALLALMFVVLGCGFRPRSISGLPVWLAAARSPDSGESPVGMGVTRGRAANLAVFSGAVVLLGWGLLTARFVRALVGIAGVMRFARTRGRSLSDPITSRLSGSVRVVELDWELPPMTVGLRRPMVLMPAGARDDLDGDEYRAVLAHECAHGRLADGVLSIVLALARALLFFQPLLRPLWLRTQIDRERLCDDAAVRWTGDALALASGLAKLARRRASPLPIARSAGGHLPDRIGRLLGQPSPTRTTAPRRRVATSIAFVATLLAFPIPFLAAGPPLADRGGRTIRVHIEESSPSIPPPGAFLLVRQPSVGAALTAPDPVPRVASVIPDGTAESRSRESRQPKSRQR